MIQVGGAIALAVFALLVVLVCLRVVATFLWHPPPQVVSCQLGAPNMDVRVSPAHVPGPNVPPHHVFRTFSGVFGECAVYFYERPKKGN